MSKAARGDVFKAGIVNEYEMPTTLHVNLKKFKDLGSYDVGHKCTGTFSGVVKSISKSKDGDSRMEIEIKSINKGGKDASYDKGEKDTEENE